VERAVRERDANQCTFVDEHGHRCSETRFLTIEHDWPYAFGGPPTVENCRRLCAGHNAYTARLVFGREHIERKIAQARQAKPEALTAGRGPVHDRVLSALVAMGESFAPHTDLAAGAATQVAEVGEIFRRPGSSSRTASTNTRNFAGGVPVR
jgi:hypothetical protein